MSPAQVASTACTEDTSLRWGREEKPKKAFLLHDCGQHKAPLSNLLVPGRGALRGGHGVAMPRAGGSRQGDAHALPDRARPAPRGASRRPLSACNPAQARSGGQRPARAVGWAPAVPGADRQAVVVRPSRPRAAQRPGAEREEPREEERAAGQRQQHRCGCECGRSLRSVLGAGGSAARPALPISNLLPLRPAAATRAPPALAASPRRSPA